MTNSQQSGEEAASAGVWMDACAPSDPLKAAGYWASLERKAHEERTTATLAALDAGNSYGAVGRACGVNAQTIHRGAERARARRNRDT